MNLNITNGSRTIWVSAEGRNIHVDKLEITHLINILEKLHQKAELKVIGNEKRHQYLIEYCPTYDALYRRASKIKLGFWLLDGFGRPTKQALAWVDKQRELTEQTKYENKVIKQLDLLTGNADNALDIIAEKVAAKLTAKKRKR